MIGYLQAVGCSLVALSDYTAVGTSEVSLREGQQAELLKVGCAGWWYVRLAGEIQTGFFLNIFIRNSTQFPPQSIIKFIIPRQNW